MSEFFLGIFVCAIILFVMCFIDKIVKKHIKGVRDRVRRIFRKISKVRKELREREKELAAEEKATIEEIVETIKKADEEIAEKVKSVQAMNTVTFECPCKHNMVAAFIDLSKEENTFICPECHNEYSVKISMVPVLKGKIVDETNMYRLLQDAAEKNV